MSVLRRGGLPATALGLAAWLAGCSSLGGDGPRRALPYPVDLADRVRALETRMAAQEAELARLRDVRPPAAAASPVAPRPAPDTPAVDPSTLADPTAVAPPGAVESSDLEDLPRFGTDERPAVAAGSAATAVPADYESAGELYRQGRYAEAEAAFQRFLATDPEGDLADNALFWIGAARLARGEPAAAEEAFRAVVERYPDGNKVPDALLKLATCRERAGDPAGAAAALDAVLERFPGSEAAVQAARRLPAVTP